MNIFDTNLSTSLPWTGERYLPEKHGDIEAEHLHRYLFAKRLSIGKRVLDIASGEGYGSALLAESAKFVIGVDIAADAITHAAIKYKFNNLEFKIGSCSDIPLENHSVDVVVSFETIEHHTEHDAMMREIKRVLVPKGLLIISCPDKLEYSDRPGNSNKYHVKELYREEFKALLEAFFCHHFMCGQKVAYGSAIFQMDGVSKIRSYGLRDNKFVAARGIPRALYLIAVASDGDLPLAESGILEQQFDDNHAVREVAWQNFKLKQIVDEHDKHINNLIQTVTLREKQIAIFKHTLQEQESRNIKLYRNISQNTFLKFLSILDKISWKKWIGFYRLRRELRAQSLLDIQWYLSQYPDVRKSKLSAIGHYYFFGAEEERNPNPYFDTHWYLTEYPDVARSGINPLLHFITHGIRERRNPNPYFNTQWYLSEYPDVVDSNMNPLLHYMMYGASEGRNPNPYFDACWYSSEYPDVTDSGMNPLLHYLKEGALQGRNPSPYFDTQWYLKEYPEVGNVGIDPLLHYLKYGLEEGKNPNPYFDTRWYLTEYPEVACMCLDPFLHYLKHGAKEGKNPIPCFDTCWYLSEYPDVALSKVNPLLHYMRYGAEEGRNPNAIFDTRWYLTEYPDVAISGMNPLLHYMKHGSKEGRNPSPYFNTKCYLFEYPEVASSGMNPLHHYLKHGIKEGRNILLEHSIIPSFAKVRSGRPSSMPIMLHCSTSFASNNLESAIFDLVLVTFNSEQWIEKCLNSLLLYEKSISITIVDNASTDATVEKLKLYQHKFSAFKIINNNLNCGFGAANNQGSQFGSSDYLVFLNIDTELHDTETFSKLKNIISASKTDVAAWEFRQLPYEHPKCYDPVSLETGWFSAAAVAVKRDAFEAVGGFDEKLFMYCEDVDLSWRLRSEGYRLLYCPSITITHHSYSQPGEAKPIAQLFGVKHNYFLRNRYGNEWDIQIGKDLLIRFSRYAKMHLSPSIYEQLADTEDKSAYFRMTRSESNHFFQPFFDQYDYEIRREGDFYCSAVSQQTAKVSVILRTIGRLQYLEHAIYSIINQTYRNIEIVIIEDGSSKAKQLVSKFNDFNVVYQTTEKVGRCLAGNIGLELATGAFFNFLDEDDLLYCDHIETLVNAITANPECGAVWSSAFCVTTMETSDRQSYYERNYILAHTVEPDNNSMLERNHFPIQAVLFRRECYEDLGGLDPEFDLLEDWDLWIRYLRKFKFMRVPKTTSLYRVPFERDIYDERKRNLDQYYERIRMKYSSNPSSS